MNILIEVGPTRMMDVEANFAEMRTSPTVALANTSSTQKRRMRRKNCLLLIEFRSYGPISCVGHGYGKVSGPFSSISFVFK